MKIAVCGKGGVGKTTVAATLARLLGREGTRVLAVDADPNTTLATALGVAADVAARIVPLTENDELVKARTGIDPSRAVGSIFRLNPRVDDLAAKYGVAAPDNVTLLVAGTVRAGGSGCMCPSGALLKALVRHLILGSDEAFVMDMEAGIENLGRGTTRGMDSLVVVVEPGQAAISTAARIRKLAHDIGVEHIVAVANKVMDDRDRTVVASALAEQGIPLLAVIPFDPAIHQAGMLGEPPLDYAPKSPAMKALAAFLPALKTHLREVQSKPQPHSTSKILPKG